MRRGFFPPLLLASAILITLFWGKSFREYALFSPQAGAEEESNLQIIERELILIKERESALIDQIDALLLRGSTPLQAKGGDAHFFERRTQEAKLREELYKKSVFASVIKREPFSWCSLAWIDVGEETNQSLGFQTVSLHSPVLCGDVLVGFIEHVGKKTSRVRFITDSDISISVRAYRSSGIHPIFRVRAEALLELLSFLSIEGDSVNKAKEALSTLISSIPSSDLELLAKGELKGGKNMLFRLTDDELIGEGFNFDYGDSEGGALDLRTGMPLGGSLYKKRKALLEVGDYLVTTGLDGFFPSGIPVAIITEIEPLQEGSFSYSLKAKPLSPPIRTLRSLTVLPPIIQPPLPESLRFMK